MRKGVRIGKLFGMNINIDWSWFFIFVLLTWNLAIVFGQAHSDWGLGFRWSLAVIASLLFFAAETLTKLMQRDVRQLPVVRGNHLAGLLRRRDIMKWLQLQSEAI